MIRNDGWRRFNIWEHSQTVRDLYRRRCLREVEEMTAHAQVVELIAPYVAQGDVLLDAGCGSGYLFHSFATRKMSLEYFGIDAAESLIAIGRETMPNFGLPADRLLMQRIEDTDGECDHIICVNVLSNIDNYHRPLERMLLMARKTVILRESLKHGAEYRYVTDDFLDAGSNLKVHVNHYDLADMTGFIESYGFDVRHVVDRRTGGTPESVIGHDHHWKFLVATRRR